MQMNGLRWQTLSDTPRVRMLAYGCETVICRIGNKLSTTEKYGENKNYTKRGVYSQPQRDA